jgi:hypothetical protein
MQGLKFIETQFFWDYRLMASNCAGPNAKVAQDSVPFFVADDVPVAVSMQ